MSYLGPFNINDEEGKVLLQNDACSLLAADAVMRGGARWELSGPPLTPGWLPDGMIPGSEGFWGGRVTGETWGAALVSSNRFVDAR